MDRGWRQPTGDWRLVIPNEPRAPYALEPNSFPFPALVALAGRAPLGGQRETALACFVVGRLLAASTVAAASDSEGGRERFLGVKHWLGSAALAGPLKLALTRATECVSEGDKAGVKSALDSVMTITANQLDPAARLELARLAQAIVK
jgi:hypothetical protein